MQIILIYKSPRTFSLPHFLSNPGQSNVATFDPLNALGGQFSGRCPKTPAVLCFYHLNDQHSKNSNNLLCFLFSCSKGLWEEEEGHRNISPRVSTGQVKHTGKDRLRPNEDGVVMTR